MLLNSQIMGIVQCTYNYIADNSLIMYSPSYLNLKMDLWCNLSTSVVQSFVQSTGTAVCRTTKTLQHIPKTHKNTIDSPKKVNDQENRLQSPRPDQEVLNFV